MTTTDTKFKSLDYDWRKHASAVLDDNEIEKQFADQAFSSVAQRAGELMKSPYFLGFEQIYANEDRSRLVGIFAFRSNQDLFYAPVFFLNGQIRGQELLFRVQQKRFVPLSEDWVTFLLDKSQEKTGTSISRTRLDRAQVGVDLLPLIWPRRVKYASAQPPYPEDPLDPMSPSHWRSDIPTSIIHKAKPATPIPAKPVAPPVAPPVTPAPSKAASFGAPGRLTGGKSVQSEWDQNFRGPKTPQPRIPTNMGSLSAMRPESEADHRFRVQSETGIDPNTGNRDPHRWEQKYTGTPWNDKIHGPKQIQPGTGKMQWNYTGEGAAPDYNTSMASTPGAAPRPTPAPAPQPSTAAANPPQSANSPMRAGSTPIMENGVQTGVSGAGATAAQPAATPASPDWQRALVDKHKELGVAGSSQNKAFVDKFHGLSKENQTPEGARRIAESIYKPATPATANPSSDQVADEQFSGYSPSMGAGARGMGNTVGAASSTIASDAVNSTLASQPAANSPTPVPASPSAPPATPIAPTADPNKGITALPLPPGSPLSTPVKTQPIAGSTSASGNAFAGSPVDKLFHQPEPVSVPPPADKAHAAPMPVPPAQQAQSSPELMQQKRDAIQRAQDRLLNPNSLIDRDQERLLNPKVSAPTVQPVKSGSTNCAIPGLEFFEEKEAASLSAPAFPAPVVPMQEQGQYHRDQISRLKSQMSGLQSPTAHIEGPQPVQHSEGVPPESDAAYLQKPLPSGPGVVMNYRDPTNRGLISDQAPPTNPAPVNRGLISDQAPPTNPAPVNRGLISDQAPPTNPSKYRQPRFTRAQTGISDTQNTAFRLAHGTDFDPNSRMDRMKLQKMHPMMAKASSIPLAYWGFVPPSVKASPDYWLKFMDGFSPKVASCVPTGILRKFIIEDGGEMALDAIENTIKSSYAFAEAIMHCFNGDMDQFFPVEEVKAARVKVAATPVRRPLMLHFGGVKNAAVTEAGFVQATKLGFALEDNRDPDKLVTLYEPASVEYQSIDSPGIFDVPTMSGENAKAIILEMLHCKGVPELNSSYYATTSEYGLENCTAVGYPRGHEGHNRKMVAIFTSPDKTFTHVQSYSVLGTVNVTDKMSDFGEKEISEGNAYAIIFPEKLGALQNALYIAAKEKQANGTYFLTAVPIDQNDLRTWNSHLLIFNPDSTESDISRGIIGGDARFMKLDVKKIPAPDYGPTQGVLGPSIESGSNVDPENLDGVRLKRLKKAPAFLPRVMATDALLQSGMHAGQMTLLDDGRAEVQFGSKMARFDSTAGAAAFLANECCMPGEIVEELLCKSAKCRPRKFLMQFPDVKIATAVTRVMERPNFHPDYDSEFGTIMEHPKSYALQTQTDQPHVREIPLNEVYDPTMGGSGNVDRSEREDKDSLDMQDVLSRDPAQLQQLQKMRNSPFVFEHGVMGSMVKTFDAVAVVDKYMPELENALDRMGRMIFMFYWKPKDFEETYGTDDMPDMESEFVSNFKSFGDMVLNMLRKNRTLHRGSASMS